MIFELTFLYFWSVTTVLVSKTEKKELNPIKLKEKKILGNFESFIIIIIIMLYNYLLEKNKYKTLLLIK